MAISPSPDKEAAMKKWSLALKAATIALVFLALGQAPSARAAELEIVYTKQARQTLSETKANPGFPGAGELALQIFFDTLIETPANFPLLETVIYNQDDTVEGRGTHRGYEVSIFKNGDRAYSRFEGTHNVTAKEDGAWEVNYEGTQSYVGGTGMYKSIKGTGTYTGKIAPDSFTEENRWQLTY
jgi:hypothetical protein